MISGESELQKLLATMNPVRNKGSYVFCTVDELIPEYVSDAIFLFKEEEGITLVVEKEDADRLGLEYAFSAAWITLTVHSSLDAVGFTAAFSTALAHEGISCNVVAAYYHDHVFVDQQDAERALEILNKLTIFPRPKGLGYS
jgi:hypothetical protein